MSELDIFSIFFIALGLSADCFAVTLSGSIAMQTFSKLQVFRTSLTFGLFQAAMPVLGWLAGKSIIDIISDYDHWIAFALLTIVGGKMIWESFRKEGNSQKQDFTKGLLLITLGIATSIDALAVGLSFAVLQVNIALAVSIIGIIAFLVTLLSFVIGKKLGKFAGKRAEAIGGIILIIIAFRVLLSHLI